MEFDENTTVEKALQYKCPRCGAPLEYDPSAEKIHCGACDTDFDIEALKAVAGEGEESDGFDWGDLKKDLNFEEKLEDVRVYQCQSCGALIEADENTVATKCPYCENNVVITDRVSGGLRPNAVIPFKITKKDIPERLKAFYKNKPLLPKNFFSENVTEKAQGMYVPFWLFNAEIDGHVSFRGERVHVYKSGDYRVTETDHFAMERDGEMAFRNVPVDASVKMDNDLMDSIEPFDFSEMKDFDPAYLTGFVAERFDSTPDDELERASGRMENSAENVFKSTISGYSAVRVVTKNLKMRNSSVKYVFLPVYILNCHYGDKKYRYAINGQTGKVVGELPIGKAESIKAFLIPFLIAFAAMTGLVLIFV
ncbi:MAG: hypothetical protein K6F52_06695 [Clostridia bacterium]|nr:hypothetical protein [Clostridia bacterium]